MNSRSLTLAKLLGLALLPLSSGTSSAQTHNWNSTNGNWNNAGSWNTGTVPSGTGVSVSFNNTSGAAYDVSVADVNPTVGSITASGNANNNVRLGNATSFNGILTLAATDPTASPTLSVGAGIRLAIFCELRGTQGFTKTGGGVLNFNTNPLNMPDLSGAIRLSGGAITIHEAGNLGTGNIIFAGNATLELSAGRTANHSANKTLTVNSGATATLTNIGGTANTIFNGPLTGPGNIVFNGGNFSLNGANTLNGSLTVQSARIVLSNNQSLSSGPLLLSGNSHLNFGGTTQTFTSLTSIGSGASTSNITFQNGSLRIIGSGDAFFQTGLSRTILDLSQLSSVTINRTTGNMTFSCAPLQSASDSIFRLSRNGSNLVQASTLSIGGIGTSNAINLPNHSYNLLLGINNTIHSNNLNIGLSGAAGIVSFQDGAGNLTIRGRSGAGAVSNAVIGLNSFGSSSGNGHVNLAGGNLEAEFTNLTLGRYSSDLGPDLAGTLAFSSGNLVATNLTLAHKSGANRQIITATVNQSGGTATIQNLTMGVGGTDLSRLRSSYNLSGGTLAAWTISAGGGSFFSDSTRTISMSGNATLRNRLNGNITITGVNSSSAGAITLAINGPTNFVVDATRSFTIGSNAVLTGSGNITKSGQGTLIFSSNLSQTFNGTIFANQGNVVANSPMPSASLVFSSGTASGSGRFSGLILSGGTLDQGEGIGNFTASNLTWNSNSTIRCDLSGSNSSDHLVISGNFSKGSGSAFTFDFKGGGVQSGSYVLATFSSHTFSPSDFRATNLAPGLGGTFAVGNGSLTFNLNGGLPQSIGNFTSIPARIITDPPIVINPIPTATSGLPVVLSIKSGNATISGNTITPNGLGTIVVAANQPGNATFSAAQEVTTSFTVSKSPQTISPFGTIPNIRIGNGPLQITLPTSNSGLPVAVSIKSGNANISGSNITPTGTGVVVLAANQAGNSTFSAAAEVTASFSILNNTVTLTIPPPAPEIGSVTDGFAGESQREVSTSYVITATPAAGMSFSRWLRNGVQVSTFPVFSFTLNANTTLEAVFSPNFNILQGVYNGLVGTGDTGNGTAQDVEDFPKRNGFLTVTLTPNGNFTGNLTLENQTNAFSASFSNNRSTSFSIPAGGNGTITANFTLNLTSPSEISGHFNSQNGQIPFVARKSSYTGNNTSDIRYTVLFPPPAGQRLGYSFATLNFGTASAGGRGIVSGRLSTNETFTAEARIVDGGENGWVMPFYSRISNLGSTTGFIMGEMVVRKNQTLNQPQVSASVEWLRYPTPSSAFSPGGFLASLTGFGNTLSTANGTSMLTGNGSSTTFTLTLDPQQMALPSPIVHSGIWNANNTGAATAPFRSALSFRVASTQILPTAGQFAGQFNWTDGGTTRTSLYFGNALTTPVQLEPGGPFLRGGGYFLTGNSTIPVLLTVP